MAAAAGRFCPTDYRIDPLAFEGLAVASVDVLYVVGGLYGNAFALDAIEQLFAAEAAPRKAIVFNGDFHWFDTDSLVFADLDARVARHYRLRGNVETEISRGGETAAGCGCAYPDSVGDQEVAWSNEIIAALARTARQALGVAGLSELGRLPLAGRWQVGDCAVGITHGDHESLAGWSLAQNRVESTLAGGLVDTLVDWRIDVLASSHTCLPVAAIARSGSPDRPASANRNARQKQREPADNQLSEAAAVINNGAAGLANFAGDPRGLITRVACRPYDLTPPVPPLYSATVRDCSLMALPVAFDMPAWQRRFLIDWPSDSPAHSSYWRRICKGPAYEPTLAVREGFVLHRSSLTPIL